MPSSATLDLPAELRSGRDARGWVVDHLEAAGLADLVDTVELLVGELVANVLLHAGTRMTVGVAVLDGGLVEVRVSDGSAVPPHRAGFGVEATTGRGTVLLDALADAWGHDTDGHGKTVWFRVAATTPTDGPGEQAPEVRETAAPAAGTAAPAVGQGSEQADRRGTAPTGGPGGTHGAPGARLPSPRTRVALEHAGASR